MIKYFLVQIYFIYVPFQFWVKIGKIVTDKTTQFQQRALSLA